MACHMQNTLISASADLRVFRLLRCCPNSRSFPPIDGFGEHSWSHIGFWKRQYWLLLRKVVFLCRSHFLKVVCKNCSIHIPNILYPWHFENWLRCLKLELDWQEKPHVVYFTRKNVYRLNSAHQSTMPESRRFSSRKPIAVQIRSNRCHAGSWKRPSVLAVVSMTKFLEGNFCCICHNEIPLLFLVGIIACCMSNKMNCFKMLGLAELGQ